MRFLRIATPLVLTLFLALTACQQPAEETGEMEETPADTMAAVSDEEQLDTLRSDYEEAWNARDFDAILVMMTPEYQEVSPMGTAGYAEAETAMKDTANMPPEGATMSIETETLEIAESGDLAYGTGTTTVTIPAEDGELTTQTTSWIAGFKKVGGEWKIDRLATMPGTDAAAPQAAPATGETTEGEATGSM